MAQKQQPDSNIKHILLRSTQRGRGDKRGVAFWQPLLASEIKTLNWSCCGPTKKAFCCLLYLCLCSCRLFVAAILQVIKIPLPRLGLPFVPPPIPLCKIAKTFQQHQHNFLFCLLSLPFHAFLCSISATLSFCLFLSLSLSVLHCA